MEAKKEDLQRKRIKERRKNNDRFNEGKNVSYRESS